MTISCHAPIIKSMLEVEHADPALARVEIDADFTGGLEVGVAKKFRYVMQLIRMVAKKNQLYQFGGLKLEKLARSGSDYSMRLNRKWRLIVEFSGNEPDEKILIVRIENHYGD